MFKRIFTTGLSVTMLSFLSASAFAQTIQLNSGFLDQDEPNWIKALPIPAELYPTLEEAINAANLITHEASKLKIISPTFEGAHRLLLQHLFMMQRQLHLSPDDLAQFQSTKRPARFTVDASIYLPNPTGGVAPQMSASLPATIVATGNADAYHSYTGEKPSRRSIVKASETQNALRVSQR